MNRIFLIFIFLISIKTFPNSENEYILKSNVNLRELPSKSSEVIKVINKDEIVYVDSLGKEWCKVKTNDSLDGYVSEKYLTKKNIEKEEYFANINWKDEIIYFFLKLILARLFIYFSLKYLLKMENNTGIDSLLYKVYIRDGRSSIITTDEADKYKKFIQVNKYVFPIVIILISLIFNSWLIFIVCFFNVWIEEGEYDSYKFKTKSGKPDKRYTKSQVHYANKSEYYEIAGRALSILWIYIAIRIIIFIIRYFI